MAHKIRVSGLIKRGSFVVAPIKYALKPNQVVFINDDDFNSDSIQLAISKGFLIEETDAPKSLNSKVEPGVKVVKKTVESIMEDARNEIAILKEEDVKNNFNIEDHKNEVDKSNKILSWDIRNKSLLDQEKSQKLALSQLNHQEDDFTVQTGEIDFDKPVKAELKTEVSKKKGGRPKKIVGEAKKAIKELSKISSKTPNKRTKAKQITPVGTVREEVKANEVDTDGLLFSSERDISFVDQEQLRQRIRNHPNPNISKQNEEVT